MPKQAKTDVRSAAKEYRRQFGNTGYWQYPPGSDKRIAAVDADRAWRIAWAACKDAAMTNAMMAME